MSEQHGTAGPQDPQTPLSTRLEEQDQYLLHDAREIRRVLHVLIDKHSLVTVHLASRNRMFASALVELSEDQQYVYIDGSRDSKINEAMVQANHATCVSTLDRVPIQFRLAALEHVDMDGMVTFRAELPQNLLYLQRREYHRLRVPVSEPVRCTVSLPSPAPSGAATVHELPVLDISVGGCSLALPRDCPGFRVETAFDCQLHLPDASFPLPLCLSVRSRFDPPPQDATQGTRIGCEFTALPGAAESLIQRYIFRIERMRKARERGEA